MSIPYFNGHLWTELTRDERFYCFSLYQHAKQNPSEFAGLISKKSGISARTETTWDLGVEVCFYRDYLWHRGKPVRGSGYSPKRTFDLCLFGPSTIIIIEAKVDQAFDGEQNITFTEDAGKIRYLLDMKSLDIFLVALASSKYFKADAENGSGSALKPFDGKVSWMDMYQKYGDEILRQADDLYRSKHFKLQS
jgi:hypothetical protein